MRGQESSGQPDPAQLAFNFNISIQLKVILDDNNIIWLSKLTQNQSHKKFNWLFNDQSAFNCYISKQLNENIDDNILIWFQKST